MADVARQLLDELKQKIITVWSEVADSQEFLGEDVSSLDFTRIAEPYSVLNVQPWKRNREFGMDNNTFDSLITVYYVRALDVSNDTLRDKAHELQRYLDNPINDFSFTTDLHGAQIKDVEDVGHDRYLPLNMEFEARGIPLRAAGVGVNVMKWEHSSRG